MITIATRLILVALLCWWLVKEHEFKQTRRALDDDGTDFLSSLALVEKYNYLD